MHASSMENMRHCVERYVDASFIARRPGPCRVLDVGGADVNGSYRDLFDHHFAYEAADIEERPGVSLTLDDPYHIPRPDGSIDLVLSGQMLEHCEYFWLQFREMMRVLHQDGYLFLVAPSSGPIHRFPVDCYRFHPDAYQALARDAGCHLVEVRHDERGPWRDLVGVFRHEPLEHPPSPPRTPPTTSVVASAPPPADDPDLERQAGRLDDLAVLTAAHQELVPRQYVEIGVRHGRSLRLATCPAVGVDPAPEVSVPLPPTSRVVEMTSDAFFEADAPGVEAPIDLAFIDGMHLAEFALRDFMNLERRMHAAGAIVIDDVFPNHPVQARRDRRTAAWTGDVWKLLATLRAARKDLSVMTFDTRPAGMAVVVGVDPFSRILWDEYNGTVRHMQEEQAPPPEVVARSGVHTDLAALRMVLLALRSLRQSDSPPDLMRERLREVIATTTSVGASP